MEAENADTRDHWCRVLRRCADQQQQGRSGEVRGPFLSLSVDVDSLAGVDLLGKDVDDLQEEIIVGDNSISGKLKYVTGYTGFSGDEAEQSGHYIALHCTSEADAVITVQVDGGHHGPATLDEDGIIIFRLEDPHQGLKITSTLDGVAVTKYYSLRSLVFEEEA